jgi:cupin fold WbuC family metalloprotein
MSEKRLQTIDGSLLDELIKRARASPRRRAIHRLHRGDWEHAHRMLNALAVGTYVRPHRHASDYQSESFIALRGRLALLIFNESGQVNTAASRLLSASEGCLGIDLPPRVWHSLVALEDTVIYEVKGHPAGGYVAERDKDFAPWSPAEDSPEAAAYLRELEQAARLLESRTKR